MKKSYHSMTVPMRVPASTRRRSFGVISFAELTGCSADSPALFVTCGRIGVFHRSLQHVYYRPLLDHAQIFEFIEKVHIREQGHCRIRERHVCAIARFSISIETPVLICLLSHSVTASWSLNFTAFEVLNLCLSPCLLDRKSTRL